MLRPGALCSSLGVVHEQVRAGIRARACLGARAGARRQAGDGLRARRTRRCAPGAAGPAAVAHSFAQLLGGAASVRACRGRPGLRAAGSGLAHAIFRPSGCGVPSSMALLLAWCVVRATPVSARSRPPAPPRDHVFTRAQFELTRHSAAAASAAASAAAPPRIAARAPATPRRRAGSSSSSAATSQVGSRPTRHPHHGCCGGPAVRAQPVCDAAARPGGQAALPPAHPHRPGPAHAAPVRGAPQQRVHPRHAGQGAARMLLWRGWARAPRSPRMHARFRTLPRSAQSPRAACPRARPRRCRTW